MTTVANRKAATPAMTESASSVSSTLMATLPHRIVLSVRLASRRNASTCRASASPLSAAASRRSRLRLNTARLSPENIADWDRQKAMPSQTRRSFMALPPKCVGCEADHCGE
nr:hypothetical protein [Thiobacillus denitrificans]